MNKFMSVLLGLSLVIGTASLGFGAEEGKDEAKKEGKKKGGKKKGAEKKTDAQK